MRVRAALNARCRAWLTGYPVAAEIGTAGRVLADHFDRFSDDFDEFLPDLRVRCAEFLDSLQH